MSLVGVIPTKVTADATGQIGVQYKTQVQNIGWQNAVSDGADAGTVGQGLRMEALKLNLTNAPSDTSIQYQAHVQNIGWQNWVSDGQEAGTDGRSLRVEAIRIKVSNLPGYSVQYRVQVQNKGWTDWVSDGQEAGTTGSGLRLETIEIKLVKTSDNSTVDVSYQSHVQNIGWQDSAQNGQISGTEGQGLRVEALKIGLLNAPAGAHIKYQTHVQNIGWQRPVDDNVESGTDGKSLRVEAIKIALENNPGYSVQYRAHVQNIGWQPWVSDGQEAGTDGKSLRIEAIEIRIVKTADGRTPTPVPFIGDQSTMTTNVSSVSLNKTADTLIVGDTNTLSATVAPSNATNQAVNWTSSNNAIATVDNTGKVTAVSAGAATITVTTADGNKTSSCAVTVNNPVVAVTSVALNKTADTLTVGKTDTLSATVAPSNATNQVVNWTSSNNAIAIVNNTGKIAAVSAGTATITVTTADGNKTSSCAVTVNNPVAAVTSVALNKTADTLTVGKTDILSATVAPSNATNQAVTWTTSNNNIVTVDNTGKITAVGAGTAIITVYTLDGNKTASCTVTVNNPEFIDVTPPVVDTTTLVVDKKEVTVGDTLNFKVKITDDMSGVTTVWIGMRKPITGQDIQYQMGYNQKSGMYECNVPVDGSFQSGNWKIDYIDTFDNASNRGTCMSPKYNLSNGDFTVYGTHTDVMPPVVDTTTLVVDKKEVTVGDTLNFKVKITDDMSGVTTVWIGMRKPITGQDIQYQMGYNQKSGMYECNVPVDGSFQSGNWKIDYIDTFDNASNRGTCMSPKYNLSNGDFTVYGTHTDVMPPVVDTTTLVVDKKEVTVGDTLNFKVKITDDMSGVTTVWIGMRKPITGQDIQYQMGYNQKSGMYECNVPVDGSFQPGNWKIDYIDTFDNASNRGTYIYPKYNLSNGDFTVIYPNYNLSNGDFTFK
ncbi:Ig-like domain-containing protein [Clostridium felsineum]